MPQRRVRRQMPAGESPPTTRAHAHAQGFRVTARPVCAFAIARADRSPLRSRYKQPPASAAEQTYRQDRALGSTVRREGVSTRTPRATDAIERSKRARRIPTARSSGAIEAPSNVVRKAFVRCRSRVRERRNGVSSSRKFAQSGWCGAKIRLLRRATYRIDSRSSGGRKRPFANASHVSRLSVVSAAPHK